MQFTINREWVTERYAAQFNQPAYSAFRKETPIIGTWDDHDYGLNDAGAEFPFRAEAKAFFTKFWHIDPARFSEREPA